MLQMQSLQVVDILFIQPVLFWYVFIALFVTIFLRAGLALKIWEQLEIRMYYNHNHGNVFILKWPQIFFSLKGIDSHS